MKKLFLVALIFCFQVSRAQENADAPAAPAAPEIPPSTASKYPTVRPRPPEDPAKESSSFIGDPENLDPLRSRNENLKDDAEPVLDDIKQVLDEPPPPKPEETITPSAEKSTEKASEKIEKSATPKKKKKSVAHHLPKKKTVAKKIKPPVIRNDDEPDEALERRLHQNYERFNSEPTSVEAWSAATLGRSNEVYIVQKGDTLWTISETLFGDSLFWPKIWALNRQGIVNPHFIIPGMKVHFYPGSPDAAPTLGVGDTPTNDGSTGGAETAQDSSQDQTQVDSFQASTGAPMAAPIVDNGARPSAGRLAMNGDQPTAIPPSLPLYRSDLYFEEPRKIEVIELGEPEKIQLPPVPDIFITDRLVLTDIRLSREGQDLFNCMPGEILQNPIFIRKQTTDEYTILEPLDKVEIRKNVFIYPYRKVGNVAYYGDDKLKIKNCNATMDDQILFVPTRVLQSLKSHKSSQDTPRVLGGSLTLNQQNFFVSNYIYLDMGTIPFETGGEFLLHSGRTDENAGKVKIMDKFGSYALGLIVENTQPVKAGDTIVPMK